MELIGPFKHSVISNAHCGRNELLNIPLYLMHIVAKMCSAALQRHCTFWLLIVLHEGRRENLSFSLSHFSYVEDVTEPSFIRLASLSSLFD